jgi:bifunctional non-homologous end joining protein LigD
LRSEVSSWSSRSRARRTPAGFILPAQPVRADKPPTGSGWLVALKHDGYRIHAVKREAKVRLWSRNGRDWSEEFAAITAALAEWDVGSVVLDGEACAHDRSGWPDFHALLSGGEACKRACLFAFDLIELDGEDLRRTPLAERYSRLCELLKGAPAALKLCEHIDDIEPAKIFDHACRLGLEGIVAKKAGSTYVSGRCPSWRKVLNPSYLRGPSRAF